MYSIEEYQKAYEEILEEMYGIKYSTLKELSDICKVYNLDWYNLFYTNEDISKYPKKSKLKKKIHKELFKEQLGVLFNHTPCSNSDKVLKTKMEVIDKVPFDDRKRIIDIAKSVKLNFEGENNEEYFD